jgi:hypothetical protein
MDFLPESRGQLVDPAGRVVVDPLQDVDQIAIGDTPCSRQVVMRLWMMPTYSAPISVQQNSHAFLPMAMARISRSMWFVSIGTSGYSRKTRSPASRSMA